jgi:aspartate aminotransferase
MFSNLPSAPTDPILGMARSFAADPSPLKVDLGIGVYKDEEGRVPVLGSVKSAEAWLIENQSTKTYLSSAGNPEFNTALQTLLLGTDPWLNGRARTVQVPGGTGALRLAADLIAQLRPESRIFLPDPTWANHGPIFAAAHRVSVRYPYYDLPSAAIRFDAMMATLQQAEAGDVVVLHGCCHNPTGADLDRDQWMAVIDSLAKSGAVPLVDLAYLGFARGIEEDAVATRLIMERLPNVMIASSCSKNFSLYRERTGALTIVAGSDPLATSAFGHAMPVARANWSMPPDHGAAIVAHILSTPSLATQWRGELDAMRNRIQSMRSGLNRHLLSLHGPAFEFLTRQHGMFAMLDISPEQVASLRDDHHVHITGAGRINLAGLTESNVATVAQAIAAVVR